MQEKAKENRQKRGMAQRVRGDSAVWRERLLRAALALAWTGAAFLMGQAPMLFGTYPLGLALLCAGERHTPAVLCGLIISAFWQPVAPVIYLCVYAVAALVRGITVWQADRGQGKEGVRERLEARIRAVRTEVFSETGESDRKRSRLHARWERMRDSLRREAAKLFSEGLKLRLLTGVVCSFVISLYRIILGGFQYYDLFAALFVLLLTPAAIVAFAPALTEGARGSALYKASQAILLFSLVWGSGRVLFLGMSVSLMLGLFFVLYACTALSPGQGLAVGLLCGFAYHPLHAPGFLLAGLIFLFFKGLRRTGVGVPLACVVLLAWSVYVGGMSELSMQVPAVLVAGCAASVVGRFHEGREKQEDDTRESELLRHRMESDRHRDSSDRFRGISDAFSSLSEVFYNLSDRFRRPGALDLRRMCDGTFDTFCTDCPNKTVCWGLEYADTLNTIGNLTSALHTKGRVTKAQIPAALAHRCESVDAILRGINEECAKLTAEMLRNNRTEIFAMDYESAADIINDALEEDDGEYRFDDEQARAIGDYLTDAGIKHQSVTVYGRRRRRIMVRGVDMECAKVSVDTLRADLGELCGMEAAMPLFEVDGGASGMTLQAKRQISVIGAQNNLSADGGVSGDTVNLFSNKKDFFYALINDGMGAGKEAALTSGLCSVFLEKMLRAGNRASTSLKMLNNMIRSRCADSAGECSSTVDLLELDLMTATATFIKSGAAPSFVVRGTVVHRLQSGTAPIGIIGTLDAQNTTFYLKEGDTVVMVSDGILQDDPDCEWLTKYLSGAKDLTPEEIVYRICLRAAENDRHDDCSAIALRIEKEAVS